MSPDAKQPFPSLGPVLVVSAHAGDYVWRSGGFIAKATAAGRVVRVVCLSYGERGESQGAWRQSGMTLERAKEIRRLESQTAAAAVGAEIAFLDAGDYPLPETDKLLLELVGHMRELQPTVVLTHSVNDPHNADHEVAARLTLKARMVAQAAGLASPYPALGAPPLFRFEPHQPEMCGFVPDVLLDITDVFERKVEAMAAMKTQEHLVPYYTDLATRRGVQAVRNGGSGSIVYAEAYQRVFPQVTSDLQ